MPTAPPPPSATPLPPAPPGPPRPLRPGRPPRRRGLVAVVIALAAMFTAFTLFLVGAAVFGVIALSRIDRSNVGRVDLSHPLAIPPLLEGRDDGTGTKVFDLRVGPGTAELLPGTRTATWGINGPYLGPTLRASKGDRVRINVTNADNSDAGTTLHWHGMHLPAAMDGGPHQTIEPGDTWSPTWTVDQPAATLWYHPHPHGITAEQVWKGAAGMFLLDDEPSRSLGLPNRYGVDDVPVIVQDRDFDDGGAFGGGGFLGDGKVGDEILVNGTWGPVFDAVTSQVRLRVLNASNTRGYNLGFTDGRRYDVIATDSGLLPAPVRTDRVELAPGERAEIVVDLRAGDDVVLRSFPIEVTDGALEERANGGHETMDILRVRRAPSATAEAPAPLPAVLVPEEPATAPPGARTRSFEFSGVSINGRAFDMDRVDGVAAADSTEVWEVSANSGWHVFHLHDVRFRVIDINGSGPPPLLAGWKDTIRLVPGDTYRLLVRFEDYADDHHGYMFHCHVLQHEDAGMMGQVIVTDRGQPR
jgi:FtsP/CotA-like multicopper oxidase with cupredoxin domain